MIVKKKVYAYEENEKNGENYMNKIGVLTYHRVFNFGSLLQTYALQEYLESQGQKVEIIDYYPERLQKKRLLFHVNPKWSRPVWKMIVHLVPAVIARLMGYHMMDTFLAKYVHLTDKVYETEEDLKRDCPLYDVYLNGSDQIWNVDTSDGEVDKVFFMSFLPDGKRKAAYAGSFGKADFSENDLCQIGKLLSRYDCVSVREKSGLNVLKKAGIEGGKWVLDPTFLLKPDKWMKIAKAIKLPKHYLLVYNLNRNPEIIRAAELIANEKKLKIVNFAHSFSFIKNAKNIIYPTPNLFITLFANADYVVTDSFHGTAFSINFNREFVTIPAPQFNERLESILGLFKIEERLIRDGKYDEVIKNTIDYKSVNAILQLEREKSYNFINQRIIEVS